ncbi:MAG: GAF domain-containing protein [Pelolinea sp.]|jgi:HD-GYP domain-containing protein (c-di-GMP phosphodiesterase class II)|nr:GAF domain-containing protein [Pelolinea sp.]
MIWNLELIVTVLAFISYLALYLVVLFTKPKTREKDAFRFYLLMMALWKLSAIMVVGQLGDIYFWFRMMTVSSILTLIGSHRFVQASLPQKTSWDRWIYVYIVLAILMTLCTNWVVSYAYMNGTELVYAFTPLVGFVAGPGYALMLYNTYRLFKGYHKARSPQIRNRLKYLILGFIFIIIGSIFNFTNLGQYPIDIFANLITAILISVAILRHQLLDINVILRKSVLYVLPTSIIGTLYFLVISSTVRAFQFSINQQVLVSVFVAIAAALVFQPVQKILQDWINKIFFRERYDSNLMLQRIVQTASREIDLQRLASSIITEIISTMHIKRAGLFVSQKEKENASFVLVSGNGLNYSKHKEFRIDHPLVLRMKRADDPVMWSELESSPMIKSLWKDELDYLIDLRAELFIPLKTKKDLIGILVLGEKMSETPYSQEDLNILTTLASQTSLAIQNAKLYSLAQKELMERRKAEKNLQLQLKRLSALQNINIAITENFDLQIPLVMLLDQVVNELKVDAADVLLYSPENKNLNFIAGRGFRTDALKYTSLRMGQGMAGMAAQKREPIYVKNLASELTTLKQSPLLEDESFVSYYGFPLIARNQIKGVLEIFHRSVLEPDQQWLDYLNTLISETAIAIDNARMFTDLEKTNMELVSAYEATLEGWARTLEMRDRETEGHSQRVLGMTLHLAEKMGVSEDELVHIRRGSLLHDIGKIAIPDSILQKPGPLTDEEWETMRRHPSIAYEMLSSIHFLEPALEIPYCHHEKWDGSGYPQGLKGEEIPLSARIFAIVDVWDALSSDRPYRKAWPQEKVIGYIKEQSGTHFDPHVVEVFIAMLEEEQKTRKSKKSRK